MNDLKKYIGKEYYFFMPQFLFGDCHFTYWHFRIVKVFKKTLKAQTIEAYGCRFDEKVPADRIENGYFATEKEGVEWNKKVIRNTIAKQKEELKKYTKLHDKYREIKDIIFILSEYFKSMDDFNLNKIRSADKRIREYFLKRCKFKKDQKVRTPDRGVGTIASVKTYLYRTNISHDGKSLIEYGVKFKNGFGTYPEDKLKQVPSRSIKKYTGDNR